MQLTPDETTLLRREIRAAEQALAGARSTDDPLQALTDLTTAVETLSATQHELVNALLDRGTSFTTLAAALSTSNAAARRRYPRRSKRGNRPDPAGEPSSSPPTQEHTATQQRRPRSISQQDSATESRPEST